MAQDIIARGMAGNLRGKLEQVSEKVDDIYSSMFTFKGSVEKYSDLPTIGNKLNDMYVTQQDDGAHLAGGYIWAYNENANAAEWQYLGPVIDIQFDDEVTENSQNAVTSAGIYRFVIEHGGTVSSVVAVDATINPDEQGRITLPAASSLSYGLVKVSDEIVLNNDGGLEIAKDGSGNLKIPDGSIGLEKIDGSQVFILDGNGDVI